ncbi:hypothetical protein ACFYY8_36535 [Streptosporangium sp. NPDC001559]|uniref:hypothetical protein n=1 Tax=Streptosporangium sp. NPDC001559 TaxID=3366187 RepID=UPI0036EDE623
MDTNRWHARWQWALKARLKLRGSIDVPFRVVKTRSESPATSPRRVFLNVLAVLEGGDVQAEEG